MTDWIDAFPLLAPLSLEDREFLQQRAMQVSLPADTTVFAPGVTPENFLLVLQGAVRVQQVSHSGRLIVLYRVRGGESCIMTTSCLLTDEDYRAEAVTESEVTAMTIPRAVFEEVLARSSAFRRGVFSDYTKRMTSLMKVVEEVAFDRVDKRLAQKLLDFAGDAIDISATHQDLAAELGSAREVVSRQLKELQRRGWVSVSRGKIELLRKDRLLGLAEASD